MFMHLHLHPVILTPFRFFYLQPVIGIIESNEAAYVPAWIASDYGQAQPKPEYSSPEYRKSIYAFSHTESFGTASLVVFHLSSADDRAINIHNKQVSGQQIYETFKALAWKFYFYSRDYILCLTSLHCHALTNPSA